MEEKGALPAVFDDRFPDLNMSVLNSLRGAAAGSLMRLMRAKPSLSSSYTATVARLAADRDPAVRVACQGLCLALLAFDRDMAVDLFIGCCEHRDDRVLDGMYMDDVLQRTWESDPVKLAPLIARMVDCANGNAAEKGAFWASVGWIRGGLYADIAARCLHGTVAQRKGAAHALSRLAANGEFRPAAVRELAFLLRDEEPWVVAQVTNALRDRAVLESPEGVKLALEFVGSPAFGTNAGDLFYLLGNLPGSLLPYAEVVAESVRRLVEWSTSSSPYIAARSQGMSGQLGSLLLRLYEQSEGAELEAARRECLDMLDRFFRGRLDLAREMLDQLDS